MVRPEEIVARFLPREPVKEIFEFGSGHINNTYKAVTTQRLYLLQQVNYRVFHNPPALSKNHQAVYEHLEKKDQHLVVKPIPDDEGNFVIFESDSYWRLYPFLDNFYTYETLDSPEMAQRCAAAFASFGAHLSDMDASTLEEPIPGFHNTAARYSYFQKSVNENNRNRLQTCSKEIGLLLKYEDIIKNYQNLGKVIPRRVVHNDTKINNVMFSSDDRADFRIIDLDTMTSDFVLFDFGDMIRTGVSPSEEDSTDLRSVYIRTEYFESFVNGFLKGYAEVLTEEETDLLVFGAQLITYEQALRFLADYLEGDPYYKIKYPEHNLVRARTQIKLLQELHENEKNLKKIVSQVQLFD